MYCEDCGAPMHWRCTDNETNVSKFKCPHCGRVQLGVLDLKPPMPKREPKFYYHAGDKYYVKRTINYDVILVGGFRDEETAIRVRDGMNRVGWDKTRIPEVIAECTI